MLNHIKRRITSSDWRWDAFERIVWQMAQGAFAALVVASTIEPFPHWQTMTAYIAGGALASLVQALVGLPQRESRHQLAAILSRLFRTALSALAGALSAVTVDGLLDVSQVQWREVVLLVGTTVFGALVKGAIVTLPEEFPAAMARPADDAPLDDWIAFAAFLRVDASTARTNEEVRDLVDAAIQCE